MISDLELLNAVREATSEAFVVYGELGRDETAGVALLARDISTSDLVVLVVSATTDGDDEVELNVDLRTELDARVPDAGAFCGACGTRLRPWGRFCPNCGRDATGQSEDPGADPAELRAAVEESISGDYEFLGEMRRKDGGGRVYFGREKRGGRIAALRLTRTGAEGEFALDETRLIKRSKSAESGVSVSVTQLLRPLVTGVVEAPVQVGLSSDPKPLPQMQVGLSSDPNRPSPKQPGPKPLDPNRVPPVQVGLSSDPSSDPKPPTGTSLATGWAKRHRLVLGGIGAAALLVIVLWTVIG